MCREKYKPRSATMSSYNTVNLQQLVVQGPPESKLVFLYLTVCNRIFRHESEQLLFKPMYIFSISNILQ